MNKGNYFRSSHELAQRLLKLPDYPVTNSNPNSFGVVQFVDVVRAEPITLNSPDEVDYNFVSLKAEKGDNKSVPVISIW